MSCLFNSLSAFVSVSPQKLRDEICDYIEANPTSLLPGLDEKILLGTDMNRYVAAMRQPGTWGGAIEIQAFCQLYDAEVHVTNLRGSDLPRRPQAQKGKIILLRSPLTSPPPLHGEEETKAEEASSVEQREEKESGTRTLNKRNEMVFVKSELEDKKEQGNEALERKVHDSRSGVLKVHISWNGSHYEPIRSMGKNIN